jgi:hypothetical protein
MGKLPEQGEVYLRSAPGSKKISIFFTPLVAFTGQYIRCPNFYMLEL